MQIRKIRGVLASTAACAVLFGAACQTDSLVAQDSEVASGDRTLIPQQVGELVHESFHSPAVSVANRGDATLVWSQEIQYPEAMYIAPHFAWLNLPEGAYLVVSDGLGYRSVTYTGQGKEVPGETGFWGTHMPGDRAIIELYSPAPVAAGAVAIDRFARGTDAYGKFLAESDEKALCGADDSEWAQCLQSSEPTVYDKSRAVARLMIGGTSACTGWLVGSEGHLMTNEHCISTASAAANTDYEFMAEGSCSTECKSWGGCPGTVVASSGTLIQVDATLDYSLILLPNNPSTTYGYLQMRNAGAALGERIYIPQHAQAWGKRIAIKAGNNDAVVTSVTETPCSGGSGKDVGYMADTQGGSSGSPVLGYADHAVVALHHCANCPNRGVPIESVLEDLNAGGNLPADATTEAPPPPPVCFPAGTACVDNADCCSNSCKGRSGAKTCK